MGGQPGKPKPPGNPPRQPDPEDPQPIEEPPPPIPVPPTERPPAPLQAGGLSLGFDLGARRSLHWQGAAPPCDAATRIRFACRHEIASLRLQ